MLRRVANIVDIVLTDQACNIFLMFMLFKMFEDGLFVSNTGVYYLEYLPQREVDYPLVP